MYGIKLKGITSVRVRGSAKAGRARCVRHTLHTSVPQIDDELGESMRVLAELETCLPAIRTQAGQVKRE